MIGVSNLPGDFVSHAFVWHRGLMKDLGTLGGDNSAAIWLNDAGDIAGWAYLPGNNIFHAVLWREGEIHDLGTISGDPCSFAAALNAQGDVVGGSNDCVGFVHAFVWEEGGPMMDLNSLIAPGSGLQLINAFNINDRGEILAIADSLIGNPPNDGDHGRLVLLVPCNEHGDEAESCNSEHGDAVESQVAVRQFLEPTAPARSPLNSFLAGRTARIRSAMTGRNRGFGASSLK